MKKVITYISICSMILLSIFFVAFTNEDIDTIYSDLPKKEDTTK